MKASKTLAAINSWQEATQDRTHRGHLGASVLGGKCQRAIWYKFRWAALEQFEGQMLRLFDRGQKEEPRFLAYLQGIGCQLWETDPQTGEQWRIKFANGHGGGSADGIGIGIPELPEGTPFLTECKTHNDKSFQALQKEGLCQSKPEHFAQTQIYTVKLGLPAALYMAVNKNDDHLHLELIWPNPGYVASLMARADMIVENQLPPPRVSNNPGFYLCKSFGCVFYDICFNKAEPLKNCRTCRYSKPVEGGVWICTRYNNYPLNKDEQHSGCTDWFVAPGFAL